MESITTCQVCYLNYDTKDQTPRSLFCGHTICSKCLTSILNNPTLRKCPFDKIAFLPSQNSLAAFPPNFAIRDVLEQRSHNTCKTHPSERLKFICLTDKTKICSECAKNEEHQGHKVKKIKALKAQGARVKEELQETLLNVKTYEQEKAKDFEHIKKVFIRAIGEKVKQFKNILAEKEFEWIQQVNNILDAEEKNDAEGIFAFKQQIDETIKNITDACQDENGDMMILDRETQNNQSFTKRRTQFLKEKSSRMQNKVLEMQKSLQDSLGNSKIAINCLQLPIYDVLKEINSLKEDKEMLSEEELTKIHRKLRSIKFMSHCDLERHSSERLNISFKHPQQKEIEINLADFQAAEKIKIELVRCDMLKNESHPDALSYIFHGLRKVVSLEVSFSPQNFNNEGLSWLGNIIQDHAYHLKRISLTFRGCKFDEKSMPILCDVIFSKTINLDSFCLILTSCQTTDADLKILTKSIQPVHKKLKSFALILLGNQNKITDDGIYQVLEIVKGIEALKVLQLAFDSEYITNESFKIFGQNVLPSLKSLDSLVLCFNRIASDEEFCTILKNLPNLKLLHFRLIDSTVTDKAIEIFIEEALPRLTALGDLSLKVDRTRISKENLEKIQKISESLKEKQRSK